MITFNFEWWNTFRLRFGVSNGNCKLLLSFVQPLTGSIAITSKHLICYERILRLLSPETLIWPIDNLCSFEGCGGNDEERKEVVSVCPWKMAFRSAAVTVMRYFYFMSNFNCNYLNLKCILPITAIDTFTNAKFLSILGAGDTDEKRIYKRGII